MAAKKPDRKMGLKKGHFCPTCEEPTKLVMRIPGRAMWGNCENGHSHRKVDLILR